MPLNKESRQLTDTDIIVYFIYTSYSFLFDCSNYIQIISFTKLSAVGLIYMRPM